MHCFHDNTARNNSTQVLGLTIKINPFSVKIVTKSYEMCQFLNIKDFGPNDLYILNKDLDKDSVTEKELF